MSEDMQFTSNGAPRVRFRSARDVHRGKLRLIRRQREGIDDDSDSEEDSISDPDSDDDDEEDDNDENGNPLITATGFFTIVPSAAPTALPEAPQTSLAALPEAEEETELVEATSAVQPASTQDSRASETAGAPIQSESDLVLPSSGIVDPSPAPSEPPSILPSAAPPQREQQNDVQTTLETIATTSTSALPNTSSDVAADADTAGSVRPEGSTGLDVGIILGTLAIATLLITAGVLLYRRHRIRKSNKDHTARVEEKPVGSDPTMI